MDNNENGSSREDKLKWETMLKAMKKATDLATVGNYEFGSCFGQIIQIVAEYNPNRYVNEMKIKL
jgi:hypothetical protein